MSRYTDYDLFADVYSRHWGGFATRVVPVLDRLVLEQLEPGSTILDLCCGTGQLAAMLTSRGFEVIGIDGSASMIDHARSNAPDARFVVSDARDFELEEPVDVVLSTFDSLNHLMTRADLERTFRRVAAALKPGGVFVFDLNMEEGFRARWRGSFGISGDEEVVVGRLSYDPARAMGTYEVTIMTLDGTTWRRSDVSLSQRSYPEGDIRAALSEAGFIDIAMFESGDLGRTEVGRSFFYCRTSSA